MDGCEKIREEIRELDRREKDLKIVYDQYKSRLWLKGWEREEKKEVGTELYKLNISHIHKLLELENCIHDSRE